MINYKTLEEFIKKQWRQLQARRIFVIVILISLTFLGAYFRLSYLPKHCYQDLFWLAEAISGGSLTFLLLEFFWHNYVYHKGREDDEINYKKLIKDIKRTNKLVRIHSTFSYLFEFS